MSLKLRIREEMNRALKAGEKDRLATIRMAMAAIIQREVDERVELDDNAVLAVLEKMVKQHHESIEQYKLGGRDDLAAKEVAEIEVLKAWLPDPMAEGEVDALIDAVIAETGAESMRDMGKVMAAIKAQAQGRADMAAISAKVRSRLG